VSKSDFDESRLISDIFSFYEKTLKKSINNKYNSIVFIYKKLNFILFI
jgi:hypothetical protein